MQLLALALMLMLAGKGGGFERFKSIIGELGGEQAADAIKQAEELSEVISAVQSLSSAAATASPEESVTGAEDAEECGADGGAGEGFPLAPISAIADERITYCLSKYIALGE